jgi:nitroimidazol reductase NimA-like FMN-containing flavoprotein (pyridoxamine 5'-phosphate oxidase superfamily)
MHESERDLDELQELLDRSYRAAGRHLLSVHTPDRRLSAREVAERLQGMCLLALATVTADSRPVVGPVDGIFYRGSFYFGSAPSSLRLRHIARRPQVSATHLPGEHLAVTVHGHAKPVDLADEPATSLKQTLLAIYVPRYGPDWEQFMRRSRYTRIVAERMFAFATAPT